ncbi:MAG TPA: TolC family protein [Blastocatellia bacterium]|nr:TolC family protein [Blastocatellia bacterium]
MRLRRIQRWLAWVVAALALGSVNALAQQPRAESASSASADNSREREARVAGAKPPVPTVVSLQTLVAEALEQNPEIIAMRRNFDMMRARVPQARALPEPMLSYGYTGNAVPLPPFDIQKGDPSSARMLSFSQEIPFPGKLAIKGRMANVAAESEWWAYEQTRLNVVAEVKDAYFDLYFIGKSIETITKNKELLEKFARIAEAGFAVGKGLQQDVLKAQVEVSRLIDQLTVLEQRKQTAEARLNSLLYREPETPVGAPEEIRPRDFTYGLAELSDLALTNYPTLKAQRRRIDREQYGVELAKKDFYPDFSVSLTYFNRPGLPEMYGVNVGMKLPIWFGQKQRPAVAEATASAGVERQRLENITTLLFFRIKDRYLAATTAQRLVRLYGTTIIPQSSLALESAIAGYEAGKVDFLTLLDSLMTLRNYELSYYEQLSNVEKSIAALEPFVGVNLRP